MQLQTRLVGSVLICSFLPLLMTYMHMYLVHLFRWLIVGPARSGKFF